MTDPDDELPMFDRQQAEITRLRTKLRKASKALRLIVGLDCSYDYWPVQAAVDIARETLTELKAK